jgi:hypothetical protein
MSIISKPLNPQMVQKTFRVNGDKLERHYKRAGWRVAKLSPNRMGYFTVTFNGDKYRCHRIVWVLFNNKDIPRGMVIDHKDGDPTNNKIDNLRMITQRENTENRYSHRNGRLCGCCYNKKLSLWQAYIKVNGKSKHLGLYKTEQEASLAHFRATT